MKVDLYIDKYIESQFVANNTKKEAEHTSSGKLSASGLADPLQWQVLKTLGVEPRPLDEYVLRKFFRGIQIEDWAVGVIPDIVEKQKLIEYRGCIGFADAMVDTKNWDWKLGVIPAEIKSVANSKYTRIMKAGPDIGHIYQACYYALGTDKDNFAVIYIASDDLRVKVYIYETKTYKAVIDKIIDDYDEAIKQFKATGDIPVFEAKIPWQANVKYSRFPDWQELNKEQLKQKYENINSKENR